MRSALYAAVRTAAEDEGCVAAARACGQEFWLVPVQREDGWNYSSNTPRRSAGGWWVRHLTDRGRERMVWVARRSEIRGAVAVLARCVLDGPYAATVEGMIDGNSWERRFPEFPWLPDGRHREARTRWDGDEIVVAWRRVPGLPPRSWSAGPNPDSPMKVALEAAGLIPA